MPERLLIATVGLPRSGKTTWAKKQELPIVCPDAIRYALHGERYIQLAEDFVWATAKVMVRALFLAGHETVILDATNITKRRRDAWVSPDWSLAFAPIPTSERVCLKRAKEEGDTYIIPIIKKMAKEFEPLNLEEREATYP